MHLTGLLCLFSIGWFQIIITLLDLVLIGRILQKHNSVKLYSISWSSNRAFCEKEGLGILC